MKKSLAVLAIAAFTTVSYAQTNTVSSANIVGYVTVELPPGGKAVLLGVNFSVNGKNPTLMSLLGTKNLRAATNPSDADRVFVWNTAKGAYQGYFLNSADQRFHPVSNGMPSEPVNPVVPVGSGFLIMTPEHSTETIRIFLSGDVSPGMPGEIDPQAHYQLVANPFPVDATLDALTRRLDPQPGDQIAYMDGGSYRHFTLQAAGNWVPRDADGAAPQTVRVGESVWFIRQSTSVAIPAE